MPPLPSQQELINTWAKVNVNGRTFSRPLINNLLTTVAIIDDKYHAPIASVI